MKILFITTGFAPYEFSENIVNSKLVMAFIAEGWDVDVITKRDEGDTYSKAWGLPWEELRSCVTEVEYPVRHGMHFAADMLRGLFRFGSVIHGIRWALHAWPVVVRKMSEKKYDIVITRSPTEVPHLLGLKIRREFGIPWIANWNDPSPVNWPSPYRNIEDPLPAYFNRRLVKDVLKTASVITFPSGELKDWFLNRFTLQGKGIATVIPHIGLGYEYEKYVKDPSDKDVFTLCHAGNLSSERNPGPFFTALRNFADSNGRHSFRLDIIGVADHEVQQMAAALGIENNIRFRGNSNYSATMGLLTVYDALVVVEAPVSEGIFFPSKFVDYMQAGKPVLSVSPVQGFMERVLNRENGPGIAVDCTDPDSIFRGLSELHRQWLTGSAGYSSRVSESYRAFSPGSVAGRYRDIFRDIVTSGQQDEQL